MPTLATRSTSMRRYRRFLDETVSPLTWTPTPGDDVRRLSFGQPESRVDKETNSDVDDTGNSASGQQRRP
jgi:hypothetical protein